jgi:hypothetical protein
LMPEISTMNAMKKRNPKQMIGPALPTTSSFPHKGDLNAALF